MRNPSLESASSASSRGIRITGAHDGHAKLIAAAFFTADPALGFPPGTLEGPPAVIATHGLMHFVSGGIGFFALIAACFVLAVRFRGEGRSPWMVFSLATGVLFFAGFAGIASGAQSRTLVVAFYLAVLLAWTWLSALFRSAPVRAEG
jgi:hypothetical protein